jgi:hypothetical protein
MVELLTVVLWTVRLVTLGCALMVVAKMFGDETQGGLGKVLLAIVSCLTYTIVWGWQHADRLRLNSIMTAMSLAIGLDLLLSIALVQLADA